MFHGSMVALVTPLTKDDKVDFLALDKLVEWHIEKGTDAIVAAGTTGEAATLSLEEKVQVIARVCDAANERIPVIAGTACQSTKDTIELTRHALNKGAGACLIMTPAYIKPTQAGLIAHYSAVADACPIPIILYNVPSRTACDILPDTVAALSKKANIIGIKDATSDMSRVTEIKSLCGDAMDIYSGDDFTVHELILAGGKGCISVTANVAPDEMAELCKLALAQDKEKANALQAKLMPLHEALFLESNPIPVKWAVAQMGLISNELRLPLTPLSASHHEQLRTAMQALNLI